MANNVNYVTAEGLKKMQEELDHLESVERPKISQQIADARDKGDISENAEYDAAKEAQGMLEAKIAQLKEKIGNSRVIDESKIDKSKVQILSKVKIKNTKNKKSMTYHIVSEDEADLKNKKIAVNSPIAQGLLGKKEGDKVKIDVPSGTVEYLIENISY